MIQVGEPITIDAKMAGYSDPSVSLRHYAELLPSNFSSKTKTWRNLFQSLMFGNNLEKQNQLVAFESVDENRALKSQIECGP